MQLILKLIKKFEKPCNFCCGNKFYEFLNPEGKHPKKWHNQIYRFWAAQNQKKFHKIFTVNLQVKFDIFDI